MIDVCNKVFVYGTLKSPWGNNRLLDTSTYLGDDTTVDKFLMFDHGCPVVSPVDQDYEYAKQVAGELYQVDDPRVAFNLDCLEGYPNMYDRKIVSLTSGADAWIYFVEYNSGNDEYFLLRLDALATVVDGNYCWSRKPFKYGVN